MVSDVVVFVCDVCGLVEEVVWFVCECFVCLFEVDYCVDGDVGGVNVLWFCGVCDVFE